MEDTPKNLRPAAVALAVICDDEALLVRSFRSDLWTFPGGDVHPEERPSLALRRTLREETGLVLDMSNLQPLTSLDDPDRMFYFFGLEAPSGTFDRLGAKGPKGHDILRCKRSDLLSQDLDIDHETCLRRIAEKQRANK